MRADDKYVHEKIQQAGGLKQINKSIELIQEHLTKEHLTAKGEPFVAKNYRLSLWRPDHDELYNLVVSMFTTALTTDYLTYQEIVGIHKDKLPMSKTIDRAKTIAEVTAKHKDEQEPKKFKIYQYRDYLTWVKRLESGESDYSNIEIIDCFDTEHFDVTMLAPYLPAIKNRS